MLFLLQYLHAQVQSVLLSRTGRLKTKGFTYEGAFLDGKAHGQGKMTSRATGSEYDGEWSHGQRNGRGILKLNVGDVNITVTSSFKVKYSVDSREPSVAVRVLASHRAGKLPTLVVPLSELRAPGVPREHSLLTTM